MNWIRPEGVEVEFTPGYGRDPAARHMWGLIKAQEWNATHMMFFGADQLADRNILVKLCKHMEDGWSMATGVVPARGILDIDGSGTKVAFPRVAWKWKDNLTEEQQRNKRPSIEFLQPITKEGGLLQEGNIIGSGAIIFPLSLINALEKPWFKEIKPDKDGFSKPAMDTFFCYRLITEAGGKMMCDFSINIIHLDVFPIDDSFTDRFDDLANSNDALLVGAKQIAENDSIQRNKWIESTKRFS
uniref:Glycosyltransferase n=1 Tax=viral metagenome TaxID=1070528 RepID=A0A6M3JBL5_9ZZZZ